MSKILNITKGYTIDRTFEELFQQLDTIISTPFDNSQFSTFGNFISADPPEFVFMNKWISFGRPMFAQAVSTKILARLLKSDDKSKIEITTKTNPAILIFFFVLLLTFAIKLLTYDNNSDIKISFVYLLLATLTLAFDRFIKNILIASFERDLTLNSK